jgi:hypothetical protein
LLPLLLGALLLALPASAMAVETETGTIEGTVSAEGGAVAGEVEVCAKAVFDESIFKCVLSGGGSYKITELPAGKYRLGFWPTGNYVTQFWEHGLTWKEATQVQVPVAAEGTLTDINAALEVGATIRGTVTAASTRTPVEEVEACAKLVEPERELELERCAKTNATGEYTIDGLAGGAWKLNFYAQNAVADVVSEPYSGGAIEVSSGASLEEVKTVNVALGPGGQIAGVVRLASTGAPLGGVLVCVTTTSSPTPLGCLRTPSSGAYRFMRVWPGSYKVVFSPEPMGLEGPDSYPTQWWGGQSTFDAAAPIAITPPAIVDNIDASLVTPPVAAPATPVVKKPILKCKRGFVKRKVHGKQHCVKRHKAKPKPGHRHHKAKHQAPQPRPARP